jgi:Ca-activated chloride channel homolog
MRRFACFFLMCLAVVQVSAQVVPDKTVIEFDELYAHSERFVDVFLKNKGAQKEFLLRVEKHPEVVYITSGSTILPDSTLVIRFQVNPTKKGKFAYKIPVYVSSSTEPLVISLSGDLKELPREDMSGMQQCPNFNQRPSDGNPMDFLLTVVTVEKGSGKPLGRSTVTLVQNGLAIGQWPTDKSGKIVKKTPLGITYFHAVHPGYLAREEVVYINFRRNYVVLELEKLPEVEIPQELAQNPPVHVIPEQEIEIVIENTETIPPSRKEIQQVLEQPDLGRLEQPELKEIPLDNFDPSLFKTNNIVFVLDVSTSMSSQDRFQLMKYALNELIEYIRPEDRIALVTYGSDARVIVGTTTGRNKDKIKEEVKKLKPSGFTAGGAGIKLGYKQAKKGYLPDGNNQVIVITDGAFNKDSDDYEKTVRNFTREGYVLSVVGIKNAPKDESKMLEVAQQGNGRYIPIRNLSDAQHNLILEIRQASFKGN